MKKIVLDTTEQLGTCIYIYICMCVYMCMCVYICKYICIHITESVCCTLETNTKL